MDMKKPLCFFTICNIMVAFTIQERFQGQLVSRYVNIIDPNNKILQPDRPTTENSEEVREATGIVGYDASTITKILKGQAFLKLSNKAHETYNSDMIDKLKSIASSWFTEENKYWLIFSMLDIIKEDSFIDEHEDSFEKFFGMAKDKFLDKKNYYLWELLVQVLFYTTKSGIDMYIKKKCLFDNKASSASIKADFKEYIEEVKKRHPKSTYDWDSDADILTIKNDDSIANNGLFNIIRRSTLDIVETAEPIEATDTVVSSDKSDNLENIGKAEIAIDEKYMVCEYCSKFRDLRDNNNHNMGVCTFSGRNYNKNDKRCVSFSPDYNKITLASMGVKFPLRFYHSIFSK